MCVSILISCSVQLVPRNLSVAVKRLAALTFCPFFTLAISGCNFANNLWNVCRSTRRRLPRSSLASHSSSLSSNASLVWPSRWPKYGRCSIDWRDDDDAAAELHSASRCSWFCANNTKTTASSTESRRSATSANTVNNNNSLVVNMSSLRQRSVFSIGNGRVCSTVYGVSKRNSRRQTETTRFVIPVWRTRKRKPGGRKLTKNNRRTAHVRPYAP